MHHPSSLPSAALVDMMFLQMYIVWSRLFRIQMTNAVSTDCFLNLRFLLFIFGPFDVREKDIHRGQNGITKEANI